MRQHVILSSQNSEFFKFIVRLISTYTFSPGFTDLFLFCHQLSVPTTLTLLPGQIIQLKEVLEKESSRRASESFEETIPVPATLSPVFSSTYQDVGNVDAMPT